jgi:hypothetical protein
MPFEKRISKPMRTKRLPIPLTQKSVFKPKKVKPELIEKFWREWEEQHAREPKEEDKRRERLASKPWTRTVWALSPSVAVTVRRFRSEEFAKKYMESQREIEKTIIKKINPVHFSLLPVQFFGRRGPNILERVFPGPDVFHFEYKDGRYYRALKRRLKRRGINLDDPKDYRLVERAALRALGELTKKYRRIAVIDVNVIFLDYDPRTRKALLAIVDHELPDSIKEQEFS